MRALIVEDDEFLSRFFERCLFRWGWQTEVSWSATEAASLFNQDPFDAVICDVNVPGANGISLAKGFLRLKPALFVIIVSGIPENIERARESGFSRCLLKPFELGELKGLLDQYKRLLS